jgi:peptidoglycan/LPS O-acetylase OafA/YrhL
MTAPAQRAGGRLPALDGYRAFALLGMLAWHAQVGWVRGGFARMTIFFVLAGFLAARSLVAASGRSTRPFLEFWGRRARRLLPMTIVGVAVAIAVTAVWGGYEARRASAGDALSVFASFSNWRFAFQDRPYGALFEAPSAFQHYWTLSVEEQCFLLLPGLLGAAAVMTRRRGPRASAVALGVLAVVLGLLPVFWVQSVDVVYYGTHVRVAEFLAGVVFALAWGDRAGADLTPRWRRAWSWAGTMGLASLIVVMLTIDRDQAWLYRGGMGLFAIPAVMLLGGVMVGGVSQRVLAWSPLAALGRWTFSIYVLHWPLYQVLEAELAGVSRWLRSSIEVGVAIALGGVVYRWIERPLLPTSRTATTRAWARRAVAVPTATVGMIICLVVALAIPPGSPPVDFERAAEEAAVAIAPDAAAAIVADEHEASTTPSETATGPSDGLVYVGTTESGFPIIRDLSKPGIATFGGSTALTLALGSEAWTADAGVQLIPGYSPLGCGVLVEGERGISGLPPTDPLARAVPPEVCTARDLRWSATAKAHRVDIAVIPASRFDLLDWRLPGAARWESVEDRSVQEALAVELESAIDALGAVGVQQFVLLTPVAPAPWLSPSDGRQARSRALAYSTVIAALAQRRPDTLVADLLGWTSRLRPGEYRRAFPDGIHPSESGAARVWAEVIGPALAA